MFAADLLPQLFQNLLVIMLVNNSAWRNKLLMNSTPTVNKITNTLLTFNLTCLAIFRYGGGGFLL